MRLLLTTQLYNSTDKWHILQQELYDLDHCEYWDMQSCSFISWNVNTLHLTETDTQLSLPTSYYVEGEMIPKYLPLSSWRSSCWITWKWCLLIEYKVSKSSVILGFIRRAIPSHARELKIKACRHLTRPLPDYSVVCLIFPSLRRRQMWKV